MSGFEPFLLFGGAALSAVGKLQEADANAASAQSEANIAQANSEIANQERVQNVRTAQVEASDKRRENQRTLASMRAAFGTMGGDLMGSPIEVLQDAATELSLDETRTRDEGRARNREGALEMLGYKQDKELALMRKKNAKTAGNISAFSSLMSGTGNALSRMQ